ncbi:putative membrane transport protein [Helianthus annuus]|nr:putative membrane transport protein [Helianthus annuus]
MVKKVRLVEIASLLAIIIGSIPHEKSFVFGCDTPLSFITDSLEILGQAMVPSVMLVLGGMLAEGPYVSKLRLKTMVGVIVARLLVLPVFGIRYVTHSAILLGAVARMRGYAFSEVSALLFWQHVFTLFSLSFYIFSYSKLV